MSISIVESTSEYTSRRSLGGTNIFVFGSAENDITAYGEILADHTDKTNLRLFVCKNIGVTADLHPLQGFQVFVNGELHSNRHGLNFKILEDIIGEIYGEFDIVAALRESARNHPPYAECDDAECMVCGVRDCPHGEPLHYHHDECPACYTMATTDKVVPTACGKRIYA